MCGKTNVSISLPREKITYAKLIYHLTSVKKLKFVLPGKYLSSYFNIVQNLSKS